jgi:hypothetical protein
MRRLPWGCFPCSACDRGNPLETGLASPGLLRPQGSLALSALSFSRDLHGLVSCRARSWGSALRSFSLRREGPDLSARSCPHAVGSSGRGLPRPSSLGSRVLLPPEVRIAATRRSPRPDRCSLGLRLSRDFLPTATATGFPAPPLAGLAAGAVKPGGRPSEFRSRRGRFVSVETTAPHEVLAPRSVPEDSSDATLAHGFASSAAWHCCSLWARFGSSPCSTVAPRARMSVPRSSNQGW